MIIVMIVVFLTLVTFEVFGISTDTVLIVGGSIALVFAVLLLVSDKRQKENAQRVVRAILIETIAMYKKKAQNTGFSIGWKGSWRSYYRYKDVLDHYECVFSVVYNDGKTGTIKCRQDSEIYNILIWKTM